MNFYDIVISYFSRHMHFCILVLPVCFSGYELFFTKINHRIWARLTENDHTGLNWHTIPSLN